MKLGFSLVLFILLINHFTVQAQGFARLDDKKDRDPNYAEYQCKEGVEIYCIREGTLVKVWKCGEKESEESNYEEFHKNLKIAARKSCTKRLKLEVKVVIEPTSDGG